MSKASSPTGKAARTKARAEPQTPAHHWRKVRENAEAVIVAIILALIIRHFSLEAFEIPTGSMAPGLFGVHFETTCPNCGTEENVGLKTDPHSGQLQGAFQGGLVYEGECPSCRMHIEDGPLRHGAAARCPGCREHRATQSEGFYESPAFRLVETWCSECTLRYRRIIEASDCVSGHKILVNKFVYRMRDPRRWEVIVFKFNRQRNYIKRLVGLPGEAIQVRHGDIWIDGEIERKPEAAQDHLWFPVHDTEVSERGQVPQRAWQALDSPRSFAPQEEGSAFAFNALESTATLEYQRPVRNRYGYNDPQISNGAATVRDLRVRANVILNGGDGHVTLQVLNGPRSYGVRLGVDGAARFEVANLDGATSTLSAIEKVELPLTEAIDLDFYVADRQLVLRVDGELIATHPLASADAPPPGRHDKNTVALELHRVGGELSRLRVYRDIHYTNNGTNADERPYQIPEDHFFAMGDNSPASLDSRFWGSLSRENLLGRAYAIFWPGLPWRWQIGFIR